MSHGSARAPAPAGDNVLDLRAAALRLDHAFPETPLPESREPTRTPTAVEPIVVVIGLPPDQAARVMEAAGERATVLVAHDVGRALHLLDHVEPAVPTGDAPRLDVDRAGRQISWCGRPLPLSARGVRPAGAARGGSPGRVWTFAALTEQVWQRPYLGDDESVVSAVKRLRRRLASVTGDLRVASVRGIGYRLATGRQPEHAQSFTTGA